MILGLIAEVRNESPDEPAITEIPGRRSFVCAFLAGGLLDIDNPDEVADFLDRHGSPDLTAGHRPVVVGFDTNLLFWNISSVLDLKPGNEGIVNGYVLATGVRDELVWSHKRKDTRSLEEAFGGEFDALWNQPRGPDREGRLGENYYRRLRDQRYAEEITTETGDEAIVAGYDAFQSEGRKDVLLFSNDRDFIELARAHRVLAQWVDLPGTLPEAVTTDLASVQNALFHLAVLFGVLEVPKSTIYGVWSGKDGTDWHEDVLRVDCRSPTLTETMERDRAIIEAYENLPC